MGNEEDRTAIADLKARMSVLERDVSDIKKEQENARKRDEAAALREKDLSTQIVLLRNDIEAHLEMHKTTNGQKMRTVDVVIAVGMLLTSIISAYGVFIK